MSENQPTETQEEAPKVEAPTPEQPQIHKSKSERVEEYLKQLISENKLDLTRPVSNKYVKQICSDLSLKYGEQFAPYDVRYVIRKLRSGLEYEREAIEEEPSPVSEAIPRIPTYQPQEGLEEEVEEEEEKPPLTPEQDEANRKFFKRFLKWLREKAEAKVDEEDENFIVDTLGDALKEARSTVPLFVRVGLALGMVIFLYVLPAINKIKSFVNRNKQGENQR